MVKYLTIPNKNGTKHYYEINFSEYRKSTRIYIEDVCIINAYKFHDHSYSVQAFSYKDKCIFCTNQIKSKKKLIEQMELFLKGHVYPYCETR